jgi:hypothetical protein
MSRHAADGMQRKITTERVAMTEKSSKPAPKRVTVRKPRATRRRKPTHREISLRAYFIHLEDPRSSEVGNWLRAERELTLA